MRTSYNGPWNHQWVRIEGLVEELQRQHRKQKVSHSLLRNLILFSLMVAYAILNLEPGTRRALVEASKQTFVDIPFDVFDANDDAEIGYQKKGFLYIHTEQEFWAWVHRVLYHGVYETNDGDISTTPSYASGFNRVIWGIRFRQLRSKKEKYEIFYSQENSELAVESSCDPNKLPSAFADNPALFSALRCMSGGAVDWNTEKEKYDETDFGFATTREELNVRGIKVNVTSAEWQWKPATFDEGIVKVSSKLPGHSDYLLDTSGHTVTLSLNATQAREKIYAMQYGRRAATGEPITTMKEAEKYKEQSSKTKFLSEYTSALFVTVHSYNTGSGFVTRSDFVLERGQEGNMVTSFDALVAPILPCAHTKASVADVFGLLLAIVGIVVSLLVLNDLRLGGQHLDWWLLMDIAISAIVCVHVWWTARVLIFGVDQSRLESALSSNQNSGNGTSLKGYDSPSSFKDLQYALIWDQNTNSLLGVNLLLVFIRILSLTEAIPLVRVLLLAFQATSRNIMYFVMIYYVLLTAFAVSTMVLLAPEQDGFDTISSAFINLQRAANGEISIWKIVEPEWLAAGQKISMLGIIGSIYHCVYMTIFKWLLVEGVLLGLVLDSWVRVYAMEKDRVVYEKKRLAKRMIVLGKTTLICPSRTMECCRAHLCPLRECLSWTCDRCKHSCDYDDGKFEAYAYASEDGSANGNPSGPLTTRIARSSSRTRMPLTEAIARISAWRSLDHNQDVHFVNFKLLSLALSARIPTDHRDMLDSERDHHGRTSTSGRSRSYSLTYDDVVWFLELMVLPYFPRQIEHQPHIYSDEERRAAVLAHNNKVTQGNSSSSSSGSSRSTGRGEGKTSKVDVAEGKQGKVGGAMKKGQMGSHGVRGGTDDNGDGDNSGAALTITALETLDRALDLIEDFQQKANSELEAKAKTILYQNNQIVSRLETLMDTAKNLEQHAPSLHSLS